MIYSKLLRFSKLVISRLDNKPPKNTIHLIIFPISLFKGKQSHLKSEKKEPVQKFSFNQHTSVVEIPELLFGHGH